MNCGKMVGMSLPHASKIGVDKSSFISCGYPLYFLRTPALLFYRHSATRSSFAYSVSTIFSFVFFTSNTKPTLS